MTSLCVCLCARASEETQVHATRHVLKTLCTDVTNALVNFLAADLMMSMDQMTSGEEPSLSGEVGVPPVLQ